MVCITMDRSKSGVMICDHRILLDANLQIVGVIDWEFTYAAPAEFLFAPPWWLLLEQPEYWPNGMNEWSYMHETRMQTFLKALEECEASTTASRKVQEGKHQLCPKCARAG